MPGTGTEATAPPAPTPPRESTVRRIMRPAHSVDGSEPIEHAAEALERLATRHLLVHDGGVTVGLISDRDVLRHLGSPRTIAQVAAMGLITISAEVFVRDAAELLLHHRLTALPVTGTQRRSRGSRRAWTDDERRSDPNGEGNSGVIGLLDAYDLLYEVVGLPPTPTAQAAS